MPHETSIHDADTQDSTKVDAVVFQRMSDAFGDDWQHFPEDEQRRICEILGNIPAVVSGERRTFGREVLQGLIEVEGLFALRGINFEPLSMLVGVPNIATIRLKIEKFNEGNARPVRLLSKNEAALLLEVEKRLPQYTEKTGRRSDAEQQQFALLALAWLRLQRKKGFTNQVSKELRDAAKLPNYRTKGPDEDNLGQSLIDLLPQDLREILEPKPKVVAPEEADATNAEQTASQAVGDSVAQVRGQFAKGDLPINVHAEDNPIHAPQPVQSSELPTDAEQLQATTTVSRICDADRALIEETLQQTGRLIALMENNPTSTDVSASIRAMSPVFGAITQRILGNGEASQTKNTATPNPAENLPPEVLAGIRGGVLELVSQTTTIRRTQ